MMQTLRGRFRVRAFTLIEMLMILAVVLLLAAFFLPMLARRNITHSRIGCVNNLKQVGLAFYIWAEDNKGKFPMQVSTNDGGAMEFVGGPDTYRIFQVMSNDLNTPKILFCPQETDLWRKRASTFRPVISAGSRDQVLFKSNTNLSYFAGVDAAGLHPNMFLSGDHNITNGLPIRDGVLTLTTNRPAGWTAGVHVNVGNILLADGSVQSFTAPALREALGYTGAATNRLAMP